MSAPRRVPRETHVTEHRPAPTAPVTVRPKRNLLRRHWLTGASIFLALGVAAYTGMHYYDGYLRLSQVESERLSMQVKLQEAQAKQQNLQDRLGRVKSDEYMEYMAKSMGFVYPQETVYQTGKSK